MELKDAIRAKREELGLTQKEWAKSLGVSHVTVSKWETGVQVPRNEMFKKIGLFNLVMKAAAIEDAMEPIDVVKPRACAGNGNGYDKLAWTKRGTQYIDKNALLGHSWQGSAFKLIDIDGDSMQPRFNDGDRVLFVEGEPVSSGDIVIAWWDSRLYIRGFIEDKNGITLKPMNTKYPEIHVDKEDERLYIAGKVIAEVPPLKMVGGFW